MKKRITKKTKKILYSKLSHPLMNNEYDSNSELYQKNKKDLEEYTSRQLHYLLVCEEPIVSVEKDLQNYYLDSIYEGYLYLKDDESRVHYLQRNNNTALYWFRKIIKVELESRIDWKREKKLQQLFND